MSLADIVAVLKTADPKLKARGLRRARHQMRSRPPNVACIGGNSPWTTERVGEPTRTFPYQGTLAA